MWNAKRQCLHDGRSAITMKDAQTQTDEAHQAAENDGNTDDALEDCDALDARDGLDAGVAQEHEDYYFTRESLPEYGTTRNLCIVCKVDMGPNNPRQLCCKTYCDQEDLVRQERLIKLKHIMEKYIKRASLPVES
tara:strand:- start:53 stop:457 length:405 start_codon:yes stop_codon:yes gene_type:complete